MQDRELNEKFPMDEWSQHLYPRLRGAMVGEDGEVTTHLSLGLPCCGLDLKIEHPATMTALELYKITALFTMFHDNVRELPSFKVCSIQPVPIKAHDTSI